MHSLFSLGLFHVKQKIDIESLKPQHQITFKNNLLNKNPRKHHFSRVCYMLRTKTYILKFWQFLVGFK